MLKNNAASYGALRTFLDSVPVIETHEHYTGGAKPVEDALDFIIGNYFYSDLLSAAQGQEKRVDALYSAYKGPDKPTEEERVARFLEFYRKTDKTAYARGMQAGLKECWGVGDIGSAGAIAELGEKLKNRDQGYYERQMDKYGIKAKIVDIFSLMAFVEGENKDYSKYCRFAFSLPDFHSIHSKQDILRLSRYLDRAVTCLDDYLESFENYLKKCVDFGVVCIKDQSAYRRTLAYSNPSRGEAEKVFNDIIANPRTVAGDDRAYLLGDWLFHHFMRLAAEYGLPVQLHTGHMAGIRNEITKTNAAHLIPVLELHQDVKFDLFHGNWPYMDEFLFLGKNYPNVWLNLCWVQMIDPIYCIELMKRAVMTVPHAKLFAFGGDTGEIEWAVGYLTLARDNVACALSELVDGGWLSLDEAKAVAADWFFNNPNEFFGLGFKPFRP